MQKPEGYPSADDQELLHGTSSNMSSGYEITSPFYDRYNDLSLLESGLYRRSYSDMGDNHHRLLERAKKLGESVDPRLLFLLEFFGEFYDRRRELLKKIFPGLPKELIEIFRKVDRVLGESTSNHQAMAKTMQRSLSLGSPRTPSKTGDESPLRLERFKIRTVNLGDGQGGGDGGNGGGGQGGQGASKSTSSK